jgi:glutamate racemase
VRELDNRGIGVFDSGVGGLTVAREIMSLLPGEQIIYFGDTLRAPYGNRPMDEITAMTRQIVRFLQTQNVKAMVVACNTICVSCLDKLRAEFEEPFVGVVEAGAAEAARVSRGTVGLIATRVTVESGAHQRAVAARNPALAFWGNPAPLFVPIIEEGFADHELSFVAAREYTRPLLEKGIDTLILGCTHYPLMRRNIQRAVGEDVTLADPSRGAAMELAELLDARGLRREDRTAPIHQFYLSGDQSRFDLISEAALGARFSSQRADIERF